VARRGRVKPYYQAGELIFYAEGSFPCGNCDFTGTTFQETVDHCAKAHRYDLPALMRLNDVDPTNPVGQKVRRRGIFSHCKAIGWYVDTYRRAQISVNLTDYKQTAPHTVLEEARHLAAERGLVVTGSEIVGLVPFQCLLASGRHYLQAMGKSTGVPTTDILLTAVFSMGLGDAAPFEIEKKVLGLPVYDPKALVSMQVHAFTDEVSRDTPAPGGGSIAALAGSLGAALASMVANLAQGGPDAEKDSKLIALAEQAQVLKDRLMTAVDADTNAFNAFMDARRLPDATPEQKAARQAAMQAGLKVAIDVPLDTAKASLAALELAGEAARLGKVASITDAAVGAQMAYGGVRGGVWNVIINLKDISDEAYVSDMQARCSSLLAQAGERLKEIADYVDQKLLDRLKKK
jgi:glutamate formiminotransferase/formiminotetrahydrofolate cyclodeaminase